MSVLVKQLTTQLDTSYWVLRKLWQAEAGRWRLGHAPGGARRCCLVILTMFTSTVPTPATFLVLIVTLVVTLIDLLLSPAAMGCRLVELRSTT